MMCVCVCLFCVHCRRGRDLGGEGEGEVKLWATVLEMEIVAMQAGDCLITDFACRRAIGPFKAAYNV